jgi:polyhydroxyalkanoate synthesis regulator phasin
MEIKPQNGHTYMTGIIRSLQDENKKLKEQVERMEMMYENTGAIFNRQHMQEKIRNLEMLVALWRERYLDENEKLLKLLDE